MMMLDLRREAERAESEAQDVRRKHARFTLDVSGKLMLPNGDLSVRVRDISLGGAGVQVDPSFLEIPRQVILHTLELGVYRAEVKWRRHDRIGLAFLFPGGPPLKLRTFVAERLHGA